MPQSSIIERLRRRRIVQWAAAYVVVALGVMEFIEGFGARWGITEDAQRLLDVVLVIGLGVTIVLAWFHGERGRQRVGALEVGILGAVLLVGASLAAQLRNDGTPASDITPASLGLAVLPFEDLSPSEDDAYFAGSMHDELNGMLGRELPVRVIASSAMRRYAGSALGPAEIAVELGVRYVLAASVRVAGETVRLSVELMDQAQSQLWTASYDAELDSERMLEVQEQIASAIASTLALEIRDADVATASGDDGSAAYVLYLQAMDRVRRVQTLDRTREREAEWLLAIDLLEEATRLDPAFVPALANHSMQLVQWVNTGIGPSTMAGPQIDSIYAIALESAERANSAAPGDPIATSALASYRYFVDRDYAGAIHLAERALATAPNHYDATQIRAFSYRRLGRLAEAARGIEALIRLDPRDPRMRWELARTLAADRNYDDARELAEDLQRLSTTLSWSSRSELAALAGDTAGIRRAAEACSPPGCQRVQLNAARYLGAHAHVPESPSPIFRAVLSELAGDGEQAASLYREAATGLEALVGLEGDWCPGSLCPNRIDQGNQLAFARAKLGDTQGALDALREAERLTVIEPRDLWGAPDFTLWRLWTAVVLEDRAMWTRELEGLLAQRAHEIMTPALARLDPLLASVRNDPEFEALLTR